MRDNLFVQLDSAARKGDPRRDHRRGVIERASEVREARAAERQLMLLKPDEAQRLQLESPDFPGRDPVETQAGDVRRAARFDMDLDVTDDVGEAAVAPGAGDGDLEVVDDVGMLDGFDSLSIDDI